MIDLQVQFDLDEAFRGLEKNGYKVMNQMGKGGFGSCYRVKNMKNKNYEQTFVCKMTNDQSSFERELTILKRADNVNIVRCYDYFEYTMTQHHKYFYLILEDCTEGNIYQRIKKFGTLSFKRFMAYGSQLIHAVSFLHEHNICHFDIKPNNIFLTEYNTVKLGDFGLSSICQPGQLIFTCRGSKPFMAPEMIYKKPCDPFKTDIYSLGVTLYFMLTDIVLFKDMKEIEDYVSTGEVKLSSEYPEKIIQLIQSCMSIFPDKRPDIKYIENYFDTLLFESFQNNSISLSHSLTNIHISKPKLVCPVLAKQPNVWHSMSMSRISKAMSKNKYNDY